MIIYLQTYTLDSLASNSILPYIYLLQPTRITSHSKTLTDNIFSKIISHEVSLAT